MMENSVVLPLPDGPISSISSPPYVESTPSRARRRPALDVGLGQVANFDGAGSYHSVRSAFEDHGRIDSRDLANGHEGGAGAHE